MYNPNDWAILPAGRCLFNKNKVSIEEIATQWDSGTIVVCIKTTGYPEKSSYLFIYGSGNNGGYAAVGSKRVGRHDQTRALIGDLMVVNEITYKMEGNVLSTKLKVPQNFPGSASLYVFK